ncbi:hypothetical protein QR721_12195 [Aciduricibacillus chroicocephali]|uniref:Uncharacterized protein n=1 Tax=Aciduricibacillus chroicocephali TaxID=3054939 RepID=A0ABY9KUG3_9BACI|nr:hypothetical protein QR721_12195 [Bacillaceae bacterium 44XB]
MVDFTSFPATNADNPSDLDSVQSITFSTTEKSDEEALYQQLNIFLAKYEKSTETDKLAIAKIRENTRKLQVLVNEKEELYLRINWLERLYKVEEEIENVQTKGEVEMLQQIISDVQTCPLKIKLQRRLELIDILPLQVEKTSEGLFMDRAIEEIGSDFINLGTAGREAVIDSAVNEGFLDMEKVRQQTRELESKAVQLQTCESVKQMIVMLDTLPLSSWKELSAKWKLRIAINLIEEEQSWNGLAMLDRIIHQQVSRMDAEQNEQENMQREFKIPGGRAASVIDSQKLRYGNFEYEQND